MSADVIRIGAWNIQDLHHQEGHSLRKFGTFPSVRRNTTDFDLLIKYRHTFGRNGTPADVVALQEIGTKVALERIFPTDEYHTILSARWTNDNASETFGDIYTAIAIRRDSTIEILDRADLPQIAMMDPDGDFTRAGTGALLQVGAFKFWFLSVHLKSGCSDTLRIHKSKSPACETLWRQGLVLRDWIAKKRKTEFPVIIAGDFNRQFRRLADEYGLWKAMNGVSPSEPVSEAWLEKHPQTVTRKCPTKKGGSLEPIDWILIDERIKSLVVPDSFFETRWSFEDQQVAQKGRGLSDHCPISLDLKLAE